MIAWKKTAGNNHRNSKLGICFGTVQRDCTDAGVPASPLPFFVRSHIFAHIACHHHFKGITEDGPLLYLIAFVPPAALWQRLSTATHLAFGPPCAQIGHHEYIQAHGRYGPPAVHHSAAAENPGHQVV